MLGPAGSLVIALAVTLLATPLDVEAQPPSKAVRIGVLRPVPFKKYEDALRQGLREQGYVEGHDLTIEWRFSRGENQRFAALARDLVELGVDVIVTSGTEATAAAKRATSTIPIVMVAVGDPVGSGFVASLASPGTNVTGLTLYATPETVGKRLELLKMVAPGASRIAVLFDPSNSFEARAAVEMQAPANVLGVTPILVEARPGGFEHAFALARQQRADALYVLEGHVNFSNRRRILKFAAEARLPAIYGLQPFVDDGGLIAYAASLADLYRRSADYVAKILRGARPADLPVAQPTEFDLVINLKTAKTLGLVVPSALLLRADRVIE